MISLSFILFFPLALAADNGMDMSMDGGMTLASGMMRPYLHFTPGDTLWFLGWVPQSTGAMVGACIGLFMLALLDRWVSAMRNVAEAHWARRAQLLLMKQGNLRDSKTTSSESSNVYHCDDDNDDKNKKIAKAGILGQFNTRTIPPFIPSHDIARGLIQAVQSAFIFVFMLAVMTYQAAFILAIIVGMGVGETLFGRYSTGTVGFH